MAHPQAGGTKRIGGLLTVLGMISSCLYSAQVFKYNTTKPENGYLIQNVPGEKWLKRNYCGPACLAMVLNYWEGKGSFSQQKITDDIFDSENQATYNSEMVLYPRSKGFASYSFQGDLRILKEVVARGIPVIALTKPIKQIPKGHYRVVIGYDDDKDQVIFHDPFFGSRYAMSSKNFLKVWELGKGRNECRWMLAVVPGQSPFPFPALQNDPLTAINLATAYYRRSDFTKSKEQWEKAREFLKTDPYPLYSLGMISLREGKFAEAEAYARQAIGLDAKSAYAHDVLGLAYAKQEKIEPALQSLELAQRLAPGEKFIRKHYLQVRALRIERARHEIVKNKEK
ncbi:MAG: C39 family peptidase [Acidobacteriota bacterium]|jgi:tetratricopeptide (TPR) repeat protein|nr:C39 family peptidase [Acidobacteriota bacterium]